jgi:hypothetical protein
MRFSRKSMSAGQSAKIDRPGEEIISHSSSHKLREDRDCARDSDRWSFQIFVRHTFDLRNYRRHKLKKSLQGRLVAAFYIRCRGLNGRSRRRQAFGYPGAAATPATDDYPQTNVPVGNVRAATASPTLKNNNGRGNRAGPAEPPRNYRNDRPVNR